MQNSGKAAPAPDDYYGESAATFGDRLAAAREQTGLGQAQLAHRLGVTAATVSSWEEDRSEPRANRLQMMAGLLNVSVGWLLSGAGDGLDGPPADIAEADDQAEALLREVSAIRAEHLVLIDRLERLEKRLKGRRRRRADD